MWLLRTVALAVTVIFILIFLLQNMGTASLQNAFSFQFLHLKSPNIPVMIWLIIAFLAGMFLYMLISVVREIRLRSAIGKLKRELEQYVPLEQEEKETENEDGKE